MGVEVLRTNGRSQETSLLDWRKKSPVVKAAEKKRELEVLHQGRNNARAETTPKKNREEEDAAKELLKEVQDRKQQYTTRQQLHGKQSHTSRVRQPKKVPVAFGDGWVNNNTVCTNSRLGHANNRASTRALVITVQNDSSRMKFAHNAILIGGTCDLLTDVNLVFCEVYLLSCGAARVDSVFFARCSSVMLDVPVRSPFVGERFCGEYVPAC